MFDDFSLFIMLYTIALFGMLGLCIALYIRVRALSRTRDILNSVINASPYGEVIFDSRGRFLKANLQAIDYFSRVSDRKLRELRQADFIDVLFDRAAEFDDAINNTVAMRYGVNQDTEFREVVAFSPGALCLVDARKIDGDKVLFTIQDISQSHKREKNMRVINIVNAQLIQAIQATSSGIAISDPSQDGHPIMFVNQALCKFFRCEGQDLVGQGWGFLMPHLQVYDRDVFLNALRRGQHVEFDIEVKFAEQNVSLNVKFSPVYNEQEQLDMFVAVFIDTTLLKQKELDFYQGQKMESLGQLAAGIAHDFNNLLLIIGGHAQMGLKMGCDDNDDELYKDHLQKILKATDRGADLTRKMLTFSRHKAKDESRFIDVCDVIKEQSALLFPLLGQGVSLKIDVPDEDMIISGDSGAFMQVIMNLALNARDAMPEGGSLVLSVKTINHDDLPDHLIKFFGVVHHDFVLVQVADNGTGIHDDVMVKMFDPFFSTKDKDHGTGLGLSVVYGLVKEMGGVIDVDTAVGRGTIFSLYFPRRYGVVTKKITGAGNDVSTIRLDGVCILVADDELALLDLVSGSLESLGAKVLCAKDGNEALAVQDDFEGKIDLLITDVVMPHMDGVKLAGMFRSLRPETKVIFISGYPANREIGAVYTFPDDANFIAKPFDFDDLSRMVFDVLHAGTLS